MPSEGQRRCRWHERNHAAMILCVHKAPQGFNPLSQPHPAIVSAISPTPSTWPVILSPATTGPTPSGVPV